MAGRESVSYDYLALPRADDAAADTVSSEDAEGETQRCAPHLGIKGWIG